MDARKLKVKLQDVFFQPGPLKKSIESIFFKSLKWPLSVPIFFFFNITLECGMQNSLLLIFSCPYEPTLRPGSEFDERWGVLSILGVGGACHTT